MNSSKKYLYVGVVALPVWLGSFFIYKKFTQKHDFICNILSFSL